MSVKQMGLVWDLDLPPNQRLVLLAYADHADDDGNNVFPSLARMAHKTGYSKDQVRRISRELTADNLMELVERSPGHGRPHRYRLTLENGSKLQPFEPRRNGCNLPSPTGANDPSGIGAPVQPEPSLEPSDNTPTEGEQACSPSPGQFCQYLREELKDADVPLLRGRENRYGKEFKQLIAKDVPEDVLYKICDRIVGRWKADDHAKLTAEQAMGDVVNGRPPAHVVSLSDHRRPTQSYNGVFERDRKRRNG